MANRPNLIFILADDLGYADLGCTGARDVYNCSADVSPNLDAMAAEGMRFTHGYANSALCSPTRFALITGRWQYRLRGAAEEPLGHPDSKGLGLPADHPTLPSLLKASGYHTALFGKWHLGKPPLYGPRLSGYDEFFGCHSGGLDYFAHTDIRGNADLWHNEDMVDEDGYFTDLISKRAVDFIGKSSPAQPFFMSVHYTAPHWPWLTRDDRAESLHTASHGEHIDGGSVPVYQRMIHHMDEGIGLIMKALKDKGVDNNTLVVFTSDNGGERYSNNWPLMGQKMDLLEGGIRVPLIARWPEKIRAGQVHGTPSLTMDWASTFLSVAGVSGDSAYPLDGVDLSPAFDDAGWIRAGDLCWRMKHRQQKAIIRGDWKFLSMDGTDYLFNIAADVRERANLRWRQPDKLEELKAAWNAWNASLPPIPEDARLLPVYSSEEMALSTYG